MKKSEMKKKGIIKQNGREKEGMNDKRTKIKELMKN